MKICIIGTVGIPASYGGFETLVERLVDSDKAEFTVYCSSKHYNEQPKKYKNAKLVYIPFNANGFFSIFYDIFSMCHALLSGHKNFLVLGISGAIFFPIITRFSKIKLITNIDGMEWKREKFNGLTKYFLKFSESLAVKYSTDVISDNDVITTYISREYNAKSKTIAYGGDHALKQREIKTIDHKLNINHPYALSICRIEPENNIHIILEAFQKVKLSIIFIGNWENSNYGKELIKKYKHNENITLLNPIYCLDTLYVLRNACSVYIHGHSAGGTNPSLVEMMYFSKPIIAFDCSFNRATMEKKGNYFDSSNTLVKILEEPNNFIGGEDMFEIAKRRYSWKFIREEYIKLFLNNKE